jgi:hypothetical protein
MQQEKFGYIRGRKRISRATNTRITTKSIISRATNRTTTKSRISRATNAGVFDVQKPSRPPATAIIITTFTSTPNCFVAVILLIYYFY